MSNQALLFFRRVFLAEGEVGRPGAQTRAYGDSVARPWKSRIAGLTTWPSLISIARLNVSSASHETGPSSTGRTKGIRALLFSQVAELHKYDGLWSTA